MSQTLDQLGAVLRRMYDEAPSGEKVAHIHLFGITYADDIEDGGFVARQVVASAGLKASYLVEVQKGMKLSKYVVPRPRYAK